MKLNLMVVTMMFVASTSFADGGPDCIAAAPNVIAVQEVGVDVGHETVVEAQVICGSKNLVSLKVLRVNSSAGNTTSEKPIAAVAFTKGSLPLAEVVRSQTSKGQDAVFTLPNDAVIALSKGQTITVNFSVAAFATGSTALSLK